MFDKILSFLIRPRLVLVMTVLLGLISYLRIFFGAEVTDEPYHIACASLKYLGGRFYENDSYFAQTASLVYEPIIYLYRTFIGRFGLFLFVRHLYIVLVLATVSSFYFLFRKNLDRERSLLVASLPLVFIAYSIPTLGYNALGHLNFALGTTLALHAFLSRKSWQAVLAAIFCAISVFVYPSFVLGVGVILLGLLLTEFKRNARVDKMILTLAIASGLLFAALWAVTLWQFDYDLIKKSIETTAIYGSGSHFEDKGAYFNMLVGSVTPPYWALIPVALMAGLLLFVKRSWLWLIPLTTALYIGLVPLPAWTLIASPYLSFIFVLSWSQLRTLWTFSLSSAWHRSLLLMALASIVMSFAVTMTSANNVLAMAFAAQYGLIAIWAGTAPSATAPLRLRFGFIASILICLSSISYWTFTYTYREDEITNMTEMIESGPYAGIITSPMKKHLLEQVGSDVDFVESRAKSILFYDNFPAGYLFSDLYPATRSLFIHPMPIGIWDRQAYTDYYQDQSKRPDVFFQFEMFPYSDKNIHPYRNEWTVPEHDTFFDFLPKSGDYDLLLDRQIYKVWAKKGLFPR